VHIAVVIFGFLVASLLGSAFHLWKGGGPGRLILYIVLGWIGFWAGHLISSQMGWTFLSIGPLRTGTAVPGCILFLFAGHWLSLENSADSENKKAS